MKPIRVQRKRTKGWKMPPNTVYVGRPTKWGNPYIFKDRPDMATKCFAEFFPSRKDNVIMALKELRGKNLACFCPLDQPCHADVLLKLANE